ncbi:MAG: 50S ribosomal protein L24 [Clostridia bacterium]
MNKVHVKKGDMVQIMVGKSDGDNAAKGKRGKVTLVNPDDNTVVIEGLNIVKKHTKPKKANEQGGIVSRPRAIDASNVLLYCDVCKTGVRYGVEEAEDGKKVRLCKKCAHKGVRTVLEYKDSQKAEKKAVRRTVKKENN